MTGVRVGGCLAMPGDTSTSGEGVGSQRRAWGRGRGGVGGRRVFNWKEARAAAQQGSRSERERESRARFALGLVPESSRRPSEPLP